MRLSAISAPNGLGRDIAAVLVFKAVALATLYLLSFDAPPRIPETSRQLYLVKTP